MPAKRKSPKSSETVFANRFPLLDLWVNSEGILEIGEDYNTNSWVRLLDEGGMIWESQPRKKYQNLDQALSEAQLGLMEWNEDSGAFNPEELEELLEAAQASEDFVPKDDNYIAVESSMISAMRYDAKSKTLEVIFNRGGVWQYLDIPASEYKALLKSESKGSYMRSCIIGAYRERQIR